MPLRIQFKRKEAALLNKLALRIQSNGSEFRYIPFWFRKVSEDTWEILNYNQLPTDVIAELRKITDKNSSSKNNNNPELKIV